MKLMDRKTPKIGVENELEIIKIVKFTFHEKDPKIKLKPRNLS